MALGVHTGVSVPACVFPACANAYFPLSFLQPYRAFKPFFSDWSLECLLEAVQIIAGPLGGKIKSFSSLH